MPLSNKDLEREADEIDRDRRITSSTYCGGCGYNLRTLPRAYTCPECGQEYNARSVIMKGIFAPHNMAFPFLDLLVTTICTGAGLWFGVSAVMPVVKDRLWIAAALLFVALLMGIHTWRRLWRFIKAFGILRRIEAQQADD